LTLRYDPKRFKKGSPYITRQLTAHRKFLVKAREELPEAYRELHETLDNENDLKRVISFVPDIILSLLIDITKLTVAPSAWIKFRTLKDQLIRDIQSIDAFSIMYASLETTVDYGKDLIDEQLSKPKSRMRKSVRNDLMEWRKIQVELSFVYSTLSNTYGNITQVAQRAYDLAFPDSRT